jgi:hypothetical protein
MAILNFTLNLVGQTGTTPRFIYFDTNDTVGTVTTAGYLNKFVAQGNELNQTDMAVVATRATPNAREASVNLFNVTFSGGNWSLTANSTPLTLLNGLIFVGNASDVATGVSMSGDATITNTGVLTIANSAITNAKVSASAAIAFSKLAALTSAHILVGSAGNVATDVAMSGDATMANTGALTIANNAVTTAKILDANVTLAKLASGITPSHVVKFGGLHTTAGGSASESFTVTGATGTDLPFVQMVDNGTGNVTIVQVAAGTNLLSITFSADPGNDTVVSYQLLRAAS